MARRSSLVSHFAASTAMLAAAVVVVLVAFFAISHSDFFKDAIDGSLRGFSLSLAESIWEKPEREFCRQLASRHRLGIVVEKPEDHFAFNFKGEPVDPDQQLRAGRRFMRIDVPGPDGLKISFFWDMVIFARGHLSLVVALIVLLLVMIGVTYAFQLALLRPLRWLHTGVEAVSQGDFSVRVPVVRQDEIGEVAGAFNQMTRRVEQMMSDRERLLADVSHELRSPLARMKVALELLPEGDKRDALTRDVRQMEALTAALLEMERVRSRADRLEAEVVDLAAVAREVAADYADRAPGVHLEAETPAELRADAASLRVLVHNLVDNAVKFSLPDSRPVVVTVERVTVEGVTVEGVTVGTVPEAAADAVLLTVRDDGRGIAEGDAERVFEPFVKLDPARGHRTGYGLGLNLCRRIVEALGGTIELGAEGERGTRVRVRLPAGLDTPRLEPVHPVTRPTDPREPR